MVITELTYILIRPKIIDEDVGPSLFCAMGDVFLDTSAEKQLHDCFLGITALMSIFLKVKIFLKFLDEIKSVTPEGDFMKFESAADLVQSMRHAIWIEFLQCSWR